MGFSLRERNFPVTNVSGKEDSIDSKSDLESNYST